MAEHVFTALDRKRIKSELAGDALEYLETLEAIAREADRMMQANDEVSQRRVKLARALVSVNFMSH